MIPTNNFFKMTLQLSSERSTFVYNDNKKKQEHFVTNMQLLTNTFQAKHMVQNMLFFFFFLAIVFLSAKKFLHFLSSPINFCLHYDQFYHHQKCGENLKPHLLWKVMRCPGHTHTLLFHIISSRKRNLQPTLSCIEPLYCDKSQLGKKIMVLFIVSPVLTHQLVQLYL